VSVATEDSYFLLHDSPHLPTERETSLEVGCWTEVYWLACSYLFTVLNAGLLFSHGQPSQQWLSSSEYCMILLTIIMCSCLVNRQTVCRMCGSTCLAYLAYWTVKNYLFK